MVHPLLARRRRLALYLLVWVPLAALLAGLLAAGEPALWRHAIALTFPLTLFYAFVCLATWYPCRAHPPQDTGVARLALIHGSAGILSAGSWLVVGFGLAALFELLPSLRGSWALFAKQLPLFAIAGVLLYLLATTFHYLLLALEAAHAAHRHSLELQVHAREAELRALKAQIDPHFLFNCLHSVSALCGSDPKGARRMTEHLAAFLRSNLELAALTRIPLRSELALAASYLEIERVRFGERLRVVQRVDPEAEAVPVPPLLLQPLLENALKHGISHLLEGGTLTIEAAVRSEALWLAVGNPCDPDRPSGRGSGMGLANVRRRLAALYGHRAVLSVKDEEDRFRVEVRLPAATGHGLPREASASPAGAAPLAPA